MSEDERDIDVESDDVPEVGGEATAPSSGQGPDKRAHHNALERRRRDHIKDSFHDLRDCIPSLEGEKVSRAHILNKATEYIRHMQKGGNVREVEIDDLKVKNEILEEQVRALEHAKALGSADTAEDILQGVAEKVQARQRQLLIQEQEQQQQQAKMQATGKSDKSGDNMTRKDGNKVAEPSGRAHAPKAFPSAGTDNRGAKATVVADAANQLLPNSLNLLASNLSNLKSAQTLLTALQKNLPSNSNLSANVKSLAARVLASPLRPTQSMTPHPPPVPRGIVTATTVPKGSPIPGSLTNVLQQQKQLQVKATVPIASQLKPTTAAITTVPTGVQNVATATTRSTSQNITLSSMEADAQAQISPTLLSQATNQLLVANSLLQQTASPNGNTNDMLANPPQLSPELLAQVSSFLNLPTTTVSKTDAPLFHCETAVSATASSETIGPQEMTSDRLGSSSGSCQVIPEVGEITLTSQHLENVPSSSAAGFSEGTKRMATESEIDVSPKKPRIK